MLDANIIFRLVLAIKDMDMPLISYRCELENNNCQLKSWEHVIPGTPEHQKFLYDEDEIIVSWGRFHVTLVNIRAQHIIYLVTCTTAKPTLNHVLGTVLILNL